MKDFIIKTLVHTFTYVQRDNNNQEFHITLSMAKIGVLSDVVDSFVQPAW